MDNLSFRVMTVNQTGDLVNCVSVLFAVDCRHAVFSDRAVFNCESDFSLVN